MGQIRVGTASWTDPTLLASGWYPPSANSPEGRLRFYCERFPVVEVDSTYYATPAEQTVRLWVDRTPTHFRFNIKAFSLLTGQPTRPAALPSDLRPQTEKKSLYRADVAPRTYDELWSRFLTAVRPLADVGRLGALLFQFPPWFTIRRDNKQHLLEIAERCRPLPVAVEFRHPSWFDGDNEAQTVRFLREHGLTLVGVDMPQGHTSSVRPILAATTDLAIVRFHGHSERWTSRDIHEKYGYRYPDPQLRSWAPRLRRLARDATETHVIMNNCYADYAQRDAARFTELLSPAPAGRSR